MSKSLCETSKNLLSEHEPVYYEPIYMSEEYERIQETTEGLREE